MADEQFPAAATALEEYQSIEEQMASPEVVSNPDKLRKLGRRHAELGAIVGAYKAWLQVRTIWQPLRRWPAEDADFAEEAKRLEDELPGVEEKLRTALIPRDPDDARDTIMEIRPAPAARKPHCSPATCCACTPVTPRSVAGA